MYSTNDDRDLLDLYIAELRGEPVLTAQQQKDLARKMRRATNDEAREDIIGGRFYGEHHERQELRLRLGLSF